VRKEYGSVSNYAQHHKKIFSGKSETHKEISKERNQIKENLSENREHRNLLLERVSDKSDFALKANDRGEYANKALSKNGLRFKKDEIKTEKLSVKDSKFKMKQDLNTLKHNKANAANISDKRAASSKYKVAKKDFKTFKKKGKADVAALKDNLHGKSQSTVISEKSEALKKSKFKLKQDLNELKTKKASATNKYDKSKIKQNYKTAQKDGKIEIGASKAELKYDKAVSKLKTKKVWKKTVVFNKETGKIEKTKVLTEVIKPMDGEGGVVSRALKGGMQGITLAIHPWTLTKGEISKYENDNAALSALMKGERAVEHGLRHAHKLIKAEPYRRAGQLQHKMDKANAKKFSHEKGGNLRQRHKSKKDYMKRAKKSRTAAVVKKQKRGVAKSIAKKFEALKKALIPKNPAVLLAVLKGALIVLAVFGIMYLLMLPFIGGGDDFVVGILSSYLSEDSDILAAYDHMKGLVEAEMNSIEPNNPNYEEYLYFYNGYPTTRQDIINSYAVDPYELISFLSAWYFAYSATTDEDGEIQGGTFVYRPVRNPNRTAELRGLIQEFFDNLFHVNLVSETQTITTNYPAGVWGGGQDLIQVGDTLHVGGNDLLVISLENLVMDSGWNIEYTLEIVGSADSDGNPVQTTMTAYDLYMMNFNMSRDYESLNIYVTTGNVEQYIRDTYTGEEGDVMIDMYLLYMETQGNRGYLFP
jgi:hypothetical protein